MKNSSVENIEVAEISKFTKVKLDLIDRAYFMSTAEDTGTLVATLDWNLRKIDPSFDSRGQWLSDPNQVAGKYGSIRNYQT